METSHLSPNFVIPVGTQVVLRRDTEAVGDSRVLKKAGSVGVVEHAPITNESQYRIRFTDGMIVCAKKADLTIRRRDMPVIQAQEREIADYAEHLILRVRMGSHAFGLADKDSDNDERGVYLPPADRHWSLQPPPEQIEFKRGADGVLLDRNQPGGTTDACWWELRKFLWLALKANPNILETLYAPDAHVLFYSPWGAKLRELRPAFLSKHLYRTYSGYVLSQFKKMKRDRERGGEVRFKHAMHLIRLLYSGIEALRGRGIMVDVGPRRDELLRIKRGEIPFEDIYRHALNLDRTFQVEYLQTALPDQPDTAAVDRFLIEARRSKV